MNALPVAAPRTAPRVVTIGAALLCFACVVLAVFDFFVPTSNDAFTSTADYLYTLDGLPLMAGLLLIVAGLHSAQDGRDGRLGRIGLLVTAVGTVAVVVCLLASFVTRSENSLGPVYVLGTFTTFLGLILFAIASVRAHVLPWWAGPTLTVAWIVGGPVGDNGPLGFKASGLLLAAVAIAIATVTPRTVTAGH
ncbi:hypothetical protein [Dactylosporangium sp. NPDC048998]|uniref:hypothetical protein n=1 Tax=Dactylosporangium sp. NPDC048998 TaxID=3363976 RepID=UPI003718A1F3